MKEYSITILGRPNTIKYGEASPTDSSMGRANSGTDTIWISDNLTDECKNETLIHEIIHQISEYTEIGLTEQQVSILAIAFNILDFVPNIKDFKES